MLPPRKQRYVSNLEDISTTSNDNENQYFFEEKDSISDQ